ncbi:helix-turn-helix domain-containing protein [Cohnella caldifontis]|uniref:helix-turn-helix domain-containing protein n=1 Tax=Cohnella caldifontis TaxID=3027471 RepID=UPI0023ECB93B|nr:helix-turn-helix domain-containing protein [Cohnella sp. YIM B05605]
MNRIIAGHFDENESYEIRRPNGMDEWLIAFTLDGEGFFRTPSGTQVCGAGEFVLLRREVPHVYGTGRTGRWHFLWAHFSRIRETSLFPEGDALIVSIMEGMRARMAQSFHDLVRDVRGGGAYRQERCENLIVGILLLAAEELADGRDPRVRQVARMLSARLADAPSINELASAVGLSASRLSHLFKAETGQSIVEMLNGIRLQQAALLMLHAGRTAGEAAFNVGFGSYNHFAALFKKRYGMSPAAYRRRGGTA